MIINDKYEFAFVHIPKCAGSSLRNTLRKYDDTGGLYTNRIEQHPKLGDLDYVHLPLFALKQHFPNEFKKIESYWSFSLVRDPKERFVSSFHQYLKKKMGTNLYSISRKNLHKELDSIIDYLLYYNSDRIVLPPSHIHFQRQVDYVMLDNKDVLNSVYTINDIEYLILDLTKRTGLSDLQETFSKNNNINQSLMHKNILFEILFRAMGPFPRLVKSHLKQETRVTVERLLFKSRGGKLKKIIESESMQEFISFYYEKDLELYYKLKYLHNKN